MKCRAFLLIFVYANLNPALMLILIIVGIALLFVAALYALSWAAGHNEKNTNPEED